MSLCHLGVPRSTTDNRTQFYSAANMQFAYYVDRLPRKVWRDCLHAAVPCSAHYHHRVWS